MRSHYAPDLVTNTDIEVYLLGDMNIDWGLNCPMKSKLLTVSAAWFISNNTWTNQSWLLSRRNQLSVLIKSATCLIIVLNLHPLLTVSLSKKQKLRTKSKTNLKENVQEVVGANWSKVMEEKPWGSKKNKNKKQQLIN